MHGVPCFGATTDVLIVGGGPVGSALAIELAMRGVDCVVIEQRDVSVPERGNIRARGVSMLSMEHLRRWGIADQMRTMTAVPQEWPRQMVVKNSLIGDEILRFVRDASVDWRNVAAEPGLSIPQHRFAAGLQNRAASLGARVHTGVSCSSIKQYPGCVKASVTHLASGASSVLEAAYVVGCDGPHSLVRKAAEITRTESVPLGQNLSVSLYFPHAFEQLGIEPSANFTIFDGTMNTLFCPYQADEWGYAIGPVPLDFDLSALDLEQETRRRIGCDADFELLWSSPYPVQQRVADTYRAGRLFIAGDAAHLFPPYLGQNMNTGLDDAVNLGWKLAAVLDGWGGDVLLDSYSDERRPIGWRNSYASVETSQILARGQAFLAREGIASGDSPAAVRSRQRLGERLYDICYQEWNTSGVVLDQRYTSSVIADDRSVPPIYSLSGVRQARSPGTSFSARSGRPVARCTGARLYVAQFRNERGRPRRAGQSRGRRGRPAQGRRCQRLGDRGALRCTARPGPYRPTRCVARRVVACRPKGGYRPCARRHTAVYPACENLALEFFEPLTSRDVRAQTAPVAPPHPLHERTHSAD
jgi:2-polyprenyl-6-methoxyphenol hydroxylase-like FAD-dependent oxidoreductase